MWRRAEFVTAATAIAFALAGGIGYILFPTTKMWWIGQLAAVPLIIFILLRAERLKQEPRDGRHFSGGDGPWWSP